MMPTEDATTTLEAAHAPLALANLVPAPAPGHEVAIYVPPDFVDDAEAMKEVRAARATLDIADSVSSLTFGGRGGAALARTSAKMIEGARNRDIEPVGTALGKLVMLMRGFDLADLNARTEKDEPGWLRRTFAGAMTTAQMALARYKRVDSEIAEVVAGFDKDVGTMMRDLVGLDRMFEDSRDAYRMVVVDIAAGEQELHEQSEVKLPALRAKATDGKSLAAQDVADLVERIQTFGQRVYDLRQMKDAVLLSMPQIRTMEIGERMLIARVQSMLQLAIPLWRQQIATLVVSKRMERVAGKVANARDFTSELLASTAAQVRRTNVVVRKEASRSLFDEAAIKKATDDVVGMFSDTIALYEGMAAKRADGLKQMAESEAGLRKVMASMRLQP